MWGSRHLFGDCREGHAQMVWGLFRVAAAEPFWQLAYHMYVCARMQRACDETLSRVINGTGSRLLVESALSGFIRDTNCTSMCFGAFSRGARHTHSAHLSETEGLAC